MSRAAVAIVLALVLLVPLAPQAQALPAAAPELAKFAYPLDAFKKIYTVGSADGGVRGVKFVFTAPMDAIALHSDYLEVGIDPSTCGSSPCPAIVNPRIELPHDASGYANNFTLLFEPVMPSSIRPVVTYHRHIAAAGAVDDPIRSIANVDGYAGMAESQVDHVVAVDLVPPSILDAVTMDRNGNGLIDAYCITFTEAIRDTSFKIGQWAVAGSPELGAPVIDPSCTDSHGDTDSANDALLTLPFKEQASLNSGSLPQLTYQLVGNDGLMDLTFGNSMTDVGANRVFERDGVRASLLRTYAKVGSKDVYLVFSEPIKHAPSGNLVPADFTYISDVPHNPSLTPCASCIQSVTQPASDSAIVKLTLAAAVTAADLDAATQDSIGPKAGACPAATPCPPNPVSACCLQDLASPTPNKVLAGPVPLTVDTDPPAPVEGLAVGSLTSTGATLSWTNPSDVDLLHAEVRLMPQGQNTPWAEMTRLANVTAKPGTAGSYTVSGLTAFRSYEVAIRTTDASKNQGASTADTVRITFTTAAGSSSGGSGGSSGGSGGSGSGGSSGTAQPGEVSVDAVDGRSAVLGWTVPDGVRSWQLRYAKGTLTEDTFSSGTAAAVPAPLAEEGSRQLAVLSGLEPDTAYMAGLRAVGTSGTTGDVSLVSFRTLADGTLPVGTLEVTSTTHASGQPSARRDVELAWTALTDPDSPVVYHHSFDHSATRNATLVDPEVEGTSMVLPELEDGTWYFHLAACSDGGCVHAKPFQLVIDGVPPGPVTDLRITNVTAGSVTLAWTAPGGDGDHGRAAHYAVRSRDGDSFAPGDWDGGREVAGAPVPAEAGANETFRVTGLTPGSSLAFLVRAADGTGALGEARDGVAAQLPEDHTPPLGTLEATIAGLVDGRVIGPGAGVDLSGVSDPDAAWWYRYAVSDDEAYDLGADDLRSDSAHILLSDLARGDHVLHVRAESFGGVGSALSLPFHVDLVSFDELEAFNQGITVQVERQGGSNVVRWTLPADPPAPVAGVQVWASNSPFVLVQTVSASDPAFTSGTLTDAGLSALATTHYLVTAFFGHRPDLGYMDGEASPDALATPGTAALAPAASGPDWLLYGGIGLGVLLLAAAGVAAWLIVRRRRAARALAVPAPEGPTGEPSGETADWLPSDAVQEAPAEAVADSRDVACYQCSTVYTAVGALPLQTTCPACGAAGLLS